MNGSNNVMKKSQSQVIIPSAVDQKKHDDKVIIKDDMMIFCVLTTAATIIQKKYREYRAKNKLQKQRHPLILQAIPLYPKQRVSNEESKNASQILSESQKIEDRFLPVQNKPAKEEVKTVKHTFSFGHNDEINP